MSDDTVIDLDLTGLTGGAGGAEPGAPVVVEEPQEGEKPSTPDDDPWAALDQVKNPHLEEGLDGGTGEEPGADEGNADDASEGEAGEAGELTDDQLIESSEKKLTAPEIKRRRKVLRERLHDAQARTEELEKQLAERQAESSEEFQSQISERDTRLRELETRLEETEKATVAPMLVGEYDPANDPDIQKVNEEAGARIQRASIQLGKHARFFQENAVALASKLAGDADDPEKLASIDEEISQQFGDRSGIVISALGDLVDASHRVEALRKTNSQNHAQRVRDNWEGTRRQVQENLNVIGNADEAALSQDPLALNSLVTKAVKGNPQFAETVARVREEAVTLGTGLAPVDPASPEWAPYVENGELNAEGRERLAEKVNTHRENLQRVPQQFMQYKLAAMMLPAALKRAEDLEKRLGERKQSEPSGKIDTEEEEVRRPPAGGDPGIKITSLDDLPDDPGSLRNPHL